MATQADFKADTVGQDLILLGIAAGLEIKHVLNRTGYTRRQLQRLRETSEDFAVRFDSAKEDGTDMYVAEAHRRAVTGIDKPIYYKGEKVDTVKEYSDAMLIFLLKARDRARFGDKLQVADNPKDLIDPAEGLVAARRRAAAAVLIRNNGANNAPSPTPGTAQERSIAEILS